MRRLLVLTLTTLIVPDAGANTLEKIASSPYVHVAAATRETFSTSCETELAPDLAVIAGGVTARSLKPTRARAQIDEQLAAIRELVEAQGGELRLLDEIRAIQPAGDRGSRTDEVPPFILGQWFEAVFPTATPVDEVLEGLLQRRMDRYGRQIDIGSRDSRPQVVVHYRFSQLADALSESIEGCRAAAWKRWCESNVPEAGRSQCVAGLEWLQDRLRIHSLNLASQPLPNEHGGLSPLQLAYPWSEVQLEEVELISPRPLRLRGTLILELSPAQ